MGRTAFTVLSACTRVTFTFTLLVSEPFVFADFTVEVCVDYTVGRMNFKAYV
jgi:hypothetical protein